MRKRSKVCFGSQYMGDDVVIQILCFMPTKSLHRFRCVSKSWNRLITHVFSRRKFLLPISGFFIDKTDDMGELEYVSVATEPESQRFGDEFQSRIRNLPFYSTFRLIHSCNGLLLFTRRDELKSPSLYYVWNPTTMEYVALPRVPTRAYTRVYQRYCFLAYDPRQSPHYKVVRFTLYRACFVDIYSSRMAKWTKFNVPYELPRDLKEWADMSVFHRGALYMLYDILRCFVRFDIENRRFHLIDLPDNSHEKYIAESREHLYYAVNVHWESELKIYRLEESNKWELAHKININREVGIQHMRPIAFDPESMVIYLNKADKILSYHPCTDNFKELHVVHQMFWSRLFSVVPCFESINPPGGKFINPCATENVLAATSSQTPDFEIGSSSRPPQPDADDAVLAHNLQLAIEASLKSPTDLHPLICATDLDMQVVSSAIQSLGDNQDLTKIYDKTGVSQPALMKSVSISGDQRSGKGIQEITDASVTIGASGVCCGTKDSSVPSSPPSFSSQAYDNLTLTASPAELEKLLSELNGTALVPILRKNELIKSEDELSEEWADICSKVLYVTSYLAMVKTKVRWENLASRLDNLKALKNSFDCSSLIRFFDLLMDYVQLIEKDNLDIIESNLHTSYYPSCRLLEDKKTKICEKSTLVEASACKVKSNIAKLEHELNNAQDCISDLRKRLAEEEAKVNEIHASLKTEKQKEVDLVDEKTLIDAEQAALEVQVNELEEYRVKVSVETETNLEKIKNLVKQVATSLSKFDLMGVPVSLEKE